MIKPFPNSDLAAPVTILLKIAWNKTYGVEKCDMHKPHVFLVQVVCFLSQLLSVEPA